MADTVQIHPAKQSDLDDVTLLDAICFPNPWSRSLFEGEFEAEGRYARVGRSADGRLAGYIFAMYFLDEMHVNKLAVAEPFRRYGIATRLMDECVKFARAHGVESISLEVRETNESAIDFYHRLGFQTVYVRKNYYANGEAAIVMTAIVNAEKI